MMTTFCKPCDNGGRKSPAARCTENQKVSAMRARKIPGVVLMILGATCWFCDVHAIQPLCGTHAGPNPTGLSTLRARRLHGPHVGPNLPVSAIMRARSSRWSCLGRIQGGHRDHDFVVSAADEFAEDDIGLSRSDTGSSLCSCLVRIRGGHDDDDDDDDLRRDVCAMRASNQDACLDKVWQVALVRIRGGHDDNDDDDDDDVDLRRDVCAMRESNHDACLDKVWQVASALRRKPREQKVCL
jgi:hypothetical protein